MWLAYLHAMCPPPDMRLPLPAGPLNHDSINKKGWAFLLPTVTPEDAKKHFPNHHSCKVPSGIDYLRLTDVSELK